LHCLNVVKHQSHCGKARWYNSQKLYNFYCFVSKLVAYPGEWMTLKAAFDIFFESLLSTCCQLYQLKL